MSPDRMLPGQMSPCQLESVLDVPRSLHLNFIKIGSVTAEITTSLGGWGRKKENNAILNSVEVKVEVGVELSN